MKLTGYAIVSLTYVAVTFVVCLVQRALHFEHTLLALVLAGITSIYVGTFLWLRDSPTASKWRVSLVLGSVIVLTSTACISVLHVLFGWFANLQVEIPVAAVGNFVGAFMLMPSVWRTMQKASETDDERP